MDYHLLFSEALSEELFSSPLDGTNSRGVYHPMQFVLRLRADIHHELEGIASGEHNSGELSDKQVLAFSTYLHETIHWWQHVGSNFGLVSSLMFPAQAHLIQVYLKNLLRTEGAFKPIKKYDLINPGNEDVNLILNYWHDIQFAGMIAFDPKRTKAIISNPYFECLGHSYSHLWSAALWTLGSTIDPDFSFLPNIKEWEDGFGKLKSEKHEGYYYGSAIKVPPFGTRSIFEGQARFSQLQYLYLASGKSYQMKDFAAQGMLSGIYVEAIDFFLEVLAEDMPTRADDPLIGLFLLVCDIAINPVDGFPFPIFYFEAFLTLNDPGYRFFLLCQMIRDKHPEFKNAIVDYSAEEYIELAGLLSKSISCFSPYDGSLYIQKWIQEQQTIQKLLAEERDYKYTPENMPIRLFFSKFLRFQQDKVKHPEFFCWPGMNMADHRREGTNLTDSMELFDKHRALFIDDAKGDIYHSAIKGYSPERLDETLNDFYTWNVTYDMVRKWINEEGPFKLNYEWLTSKYTPDEMKSWVCNNFKQVFGIHPDDFKVL